jgi:hypothetical protein
VGGTDPVAGVQVAVDGRIGLLATRNVVVQEDR